MMIKGMQRGKEEGKRVDAKSISQIDQEDYQKDQEVQAKGYSEDYQLLIVILELSQNLSMNSHIKSEIRELPHRGRYSTQGESVDIHEVDVSHRVRYKSEIRGVRQIRMYK